jgi:hypothetical protein
MRRAPTLRHPLKAISALLVLVQLAGLAHLAFARHGVCWEHGVVVELDGVAAASTVAEPSAGPGLDRAPRLGGQSDGHPHCPALWLHRQLSPGRAPELAVATPVTVDRTVRHDSIPPLRWAVLHRAPKQSPPL